MNKTAFVISAALTAFLLAIAAGVTYTVRSVNTASAAQATSTPEAQANVDAQPAQTLDPQTAQEIQGREATYQNLITQANERLAQAQQKQQELQAQLANLQSATGNAAQPPAPVQVTLEQAAQIAAEYLNQTSIYSAESTFLSGEMVYKITMSSGDIVYLSLDGGIIGTQPAPEIQPSKRTLGHHDGGGSGDDDEHEGGDDDD